LSIKKFLFSSDNFSQSEPKTFLIPPKTTATSYVKPNCKKSKIFPIAFRLKLEYPSFRLNLETASACSSVKFQFFIAYSFRLDLLSKKYSTCQMSSCSFSVNSIHFLPKNFLLDKFEIV